MQVKNKEEIQAMGFIRSIWFVDSAEDQGAFTSARLVHISFQQAQALQSFEVDYSQQLMLDCVCQGEPYWDKFKLETEVKIFILKEK